MGTNTYHHLPPTPTLTTTDVDYTLATTQVEGTDTGVEQWDHLGAATNNSPRPYLNRPKPESEVVSAAELLAELKKSLTFYETWLICSNPKAGGAGTLWIMDQHLDIFFRYAYPFAYIVILAFFFAMVPSQPNISPFLAKACE